VKRRRVRRRRVGGGRVGNGKRKIGGKVGIRWRKEQDKKEDGNDQVG